MPPCISRLIVGSALLLFCAYPAMAQDADSIEYRLGEYAPSAGGADKATRAGTKIQAGRTPELKGSEPPAVPSLFYTQQEMLQMHLAINSYIKFSTGNDGALTTQETDFLNRLASIFGSKQNKHSAYYTYPQFFLKSLVYHTSEDWTVWINDIRLKPDRPQMGDITIMDISGDQVQIEWSPPSMDRVNDVWRQSPDESIVVDQLRSKVYFYLKPNQTFSAYKMRVLEGRVVPVTVGVTDEYTAPSSVDDLTIEQIPSPLPSEVPTSESQPLIPSPGHAGDIPTDPNSKEGLSGLINRYKTLDSGGSR